MLYSLFIKMNKNGKQKTINKMGYGPVKMYFLFPIYLEPVIIVAYSILVNRAFGLHALIDLCIYLMF